jgi:mannose-6-phosphate isomerase-like protein (cupin superfamily)
MNIDEYIKSGILETYVLGVATEEESLEVERMTTIHPEIKKELEEIYDALEQHAQQKKVDPPVVVKPFLMASIDYMERLTNGETPEVPPILNENSSIKDFEKWLNRTDMVIPSDFEEFAAKIIGYTPEAITAIVWIKSMAPEEVHNNDFEKFLILEGTCDIIIGQEVHKLVAGNYLSIPLYIDHQVIVTSTIPCKVILQRIAA